MGSHKNDVCVVASAGKSMVLCEKTVSGMNRVAIVLLGDVNDLFNVEVSRCAGAL